MSFSVLFPSTRSGINRIFNGISRLFRWTVQLLALTILVISSSNTALAAEPTKEIPAYVLETYGEPPTIPEGELSEELTSAVNTIFIDSMKAGRWATEQSDALRIVAKSEDPRLAWPITDMMRFIRQPGLDATLAVTAAELLGISLEPGNPWGFITDHLIYTHFPTRQLFALHDLCCNRGEQVPAMEAVREFPGAPVHTPAIHLLGSPCRHGQ